MTMSPLSGDTITDAQSTGFVCPDGFLGNWFVYSGMWGTDEIKNLPGSSSTKASVI